VLGVEVLSPSATSWFRVCAIGIAVMSAVAALVPAAARALVGGVTMLGERPESAELAARVAFGAAAIGFGVLALFVASVVRIARLLSHRLSQLSPRNFWWLVAVVAIAPRLIVAGVPYEPPVGDAVWYHETAASLARGDGLSLAETPTAYRPPGYPFLLSLTYRVFGPKSVLAWSWGVVATALLLGAVHRIASQLYDDGTARCATLLLAGYPALVWATGQTMSDVPFTAGMTFLVGWVMSRIRIDTRDCFLAGIGVGLLTLVRAVGVTALVPLLFTVWHGASERGAFRRQTVALLAGCSLPILRGSREITRCSAWLCSTRTAGGTCSSETIPMRAAATKPLGCRRS
jgi:hypothetical protein